MPRRFSSLDRCSRSSLTALAGDGGGEDGLIRMVVSLSTVLAALRTLSLVVSLSLRTALLPPLLLLLLQVEDVLLSWLDRRSRATRSGSPPTPPLGMVVMSVM